MENMEIMADHIS